MTGANVTQKWTSPNDGLGLIFFFSRAGVGYRDRLEQQRQTGCDEPITNAPALCRESALAMDVLRLGPGFRFEPRELLRHTTVQILEMCVRSTRRFEGMLRFCPSSGWCSVSRDMIQIAIEDGRSAGRVSQCSSSSSAVCACTTLQAGAVL